MSRRSGRYGDGIVPKMACVMGYIYEGGGNLTSGKAHHPVNQRPQRRSESIQRRCGAGKVCSLCRPSRALQGVLLVRLTTTALDFQYWPDSAATDCKTSWQGVGKAVTRWDIRHLSIVNCKLGKVCWLQMFVFYYQHIFTSNIPNTSSSLLKC